MLNVYFGGTLYQDLRTERPGEIAHEQSEPWFRRTHEVHVEADTLLHTIVDTDTLRINSFHHQGVKQLAPGMKAVAQAADGLVEAIEATGHAWVLGVQWHPERHEASAPAIDPDRRLFEAFREAVAAHGS